MMRVRLIAAVAWLAMLLAPGALHAQGKQYPTLPSLLGNEYLPLSYVAPPAKLPVYTTPDQITAYVVKSGGGLPQPVVNGDCVVGSGGIAIWGTCGSGGIGPSGSAGDLQTYVDATTFGHITPGTGVATALAANVGSAGAVLVNGGALGTPSSGTLTNATGLPVAGLSNLGANVGTFLITPSSANLAAALTDKTGTGLAVFGTNPTFNGNGGITLSGNGNGVMPSSLATVGSAITNNYLGLGETDFWNLVNNEDTNAEGFFWNQKTGSSALKSIMNVNARSTKTEFAVYAPTTGAAIINASDTVATIGTNLSGLSLVAGAAAGTTILDYAITTAATATSALPWTFSSATIKMPNIPSGTPVSGGWVGLDSGGKFVIGTPAGGGSAWDITDGTHTVTSVTGLTVGTGFLIGGSAGAATLNATNVLNSPTDGGSHSYTLQASDAGKDVVLAATFTALVLPQATSSFGDGFSAMVCTLGAATATSTTSTVNGIAGATGLKTGANQCGSFDSVSGNWVVSLSVPTVATQDGSTFLKNDGTYGAPSGSGTVNSGTSGQLAYYASSTNAVSGAASATISTGALSLGASGTLGTVTLGNATSGTAKVTPATGALGTTIAQIPAWNATGNLAAIDVAQTWTASQTFGQVQGKNTAQSGTTYSFAATDCGTEVIFTSGSAVTATIPASIVPAAGTGCVIAINQSGAGKVSVNGSAVTPATLVSAHSYTATSGTAGSEIALRLTTIGGTATATLTGDGS